MICRHRPSSFPRPLVAWLALALIVSARARAAEEAPATAAATATSAAAHAPASAPVTAPVSTSVPPAPAAHDEATKPAEAAEATPPAHPAEASESAPAPAPAAPAAPVSKRATTETQGLLNLGASLSERGDYEASEIAYRQVLNTATAPENDLKSALLGLAHMHRRQGALTKAAAIYERFLKDYPGDDRTPDALLDLGRTLRGLGVYKLALARFYSVINSTP